MCGCQCNLYFPSPPRCIFKIDFLFSSSLVPLVLLLPNAGTRLHGATSLYLVVSQSLLLLRTPGSHAAFCRPWCAIDNKMSIKPHYHDDGPYFYNCKLNPLTETFSAKMTELLYVFTYRFCFIESISLSKNKQITLAKKNTNNTGFSVCMNHYNHYDNEK